MFFLSEEDIFVQKGSGCCDVRRKNDSCLRGNIMKKMRMSLRIKVMIGVLAVAVIIAFCSVLVSYNIYSETMDRHYETLTMDLARTTAVMVDTDAVQELTDDVMSIYRAACVSEDTPPDFEHYTEDDWSNYYKSYETIIESACYGKIMDTLSKLREKNGVRSIYLVYMDVQTGKAVYLIDASDPGEACFTGKCDNIEEGNMQLMQNGIYEFPAYITNYEEYGWLCSAASPVEDENGNVTSCAYVDISMNEVMDDRHDFLVHLLGILAAAALALILILVYVIVVTVIRPINSLAAAADAFVSDREKEKDGESAISRLNIHTGDEIENLTCSIQRMERDINAYILNLSHVTAEKERIGAELGVAAKIQTDMLPCIFPAFPDRHEFDIRAAMTPAKEVGGDFYDFFLVDDNHLALVMADVSGKGVPAALFMVIAKTLIKNAIQTEGSPKAALEKVNNQLCENNEAEMFVTVWLGVYEISTGKLIAANAGHEYPAIRRSGGKFELYKDWHDFVLAGMENTHYNEYELWLEPGEILFVYTDGVPEATDSGDVLYGTERMLRALNSRPDDLPEELISAVYRDIDDFVGDAPQFDDITMLVLQRKKETAKQMLKLKTEAKLECIAEVTKFFEEQLEKCGAPMSVCAQVGIATDEIFSNIVHYSGATSVTAGCETEDHKVILRFEDNGRPYDPTKNQDPDVTLPVQERKIGGLGIFIVKQMMDHISYEYLDGFNILTLEKNWRNFDTV